MEDFKVLIAEHKTGWQDILEEDICIALDEASCQNYSLKVVENFSDACQSLREQKWDLLITDLTLKHGDPLYEKQLVGIQLIKLAHHYQIPTIVISGSPHIKGRHTNEFYRYSIIQFFEKESIDTGRFILCIQEIWRKRLENSKNMLNLKAFQEGSTEYFALLIGIGDYLYTRPLLKTMNDAKDLYDALLKNGFPKNNIQLLLDKEATKAAINTKLDYLARQANVNDTVIIFFSGHGMQFVGGFSPGEYLCPVEAALDHAKDTCISSEEFANALRTIKSERLVVLLDSCHSGGIGQPKDPELQVKVGLTDTTYSNFSKGKGRVIIASCKPDEVSWELPEMPNGLFTHYLLKGLYGEAAQSDGTVSYIDLFGYISRNVPLHTPQHPFLRSEAENFVIFTTQRLGSNIQSSSLSSSSSSSQERQSISITTDVTKLRKVILEVYDRPSFEIFCTDIGLNYDHLRGDNLEAKIMYLVDDFKRRRNLDQLVDKVLAEHSYLESEIR